MCREPRVAARYSLRKKENTLTVRVHRMSSPAHDKAISALLSDLTKSAFSTLKPGRN